MKSISSIVFIIGVLAAYLWPRYFYLGLGGLGISGYEIVAAFVLAFCLYLIYAYGSIRDAFKAGMGRSIPILAIITIYFSWGFFTDITGDTPGPSLVMTFKDLLFGAGWIVIGAVLFLDRRAQNRLPYLLLICGFGATFFGIAEHLTGTPLATLLGFGKFAAVNKLALDAINAASSGEDFLRAKSVFVHPIVFGQTMAALAPIAFHFILRGGARSRLAGLVFLPCIVYSIVICGSRSPFVVLFVSTAIYFLLYFFDVRSKFRVAFFLTALTATTLVAPVAIPKFIDVAVGRSFEEYRSANFRFIQMELAKSALQSRPLTGFGNGTAATYAGIRGRNHVMTVDSYYIVGAVESGYVGLLLFIVMIGAFFAKGVIRSFTERDQWGKSLTSALSANVAGTAVGLSVVPFDDQMTLVYLFVGLLVAQSGLSATSAQRMRRLSARRAHFGSPIHAAPRPGWRT